MIFCCCSYYIVVLKAFITVQINLPTTIIFVVKLI